MTKTYFDKQMERRIITMAELAWYWWAAIVAGLAGLYYWFYVR